MFTKKIIVKQFELGHNGLLKPSVLFNYMQEVAETHAGKLGVSVEALLSQNLTWVLSRYHIKVNRWPGNGENLVLKTWPSVHEKLFALRDFKLVGETGEVLMTAVSSWMLLNTESRRPVPLEKLKLDYEFKFGRSMKDSFPQIDASFTPNQTYNFKVLVGDLDINHHVNHVKYIEWVLNHVEADIALEKIPVEIAVVYKRELNFDQNLCLEVGSDNRHPSVLLHRLTQIPSGKISALFKTRWKTRS